MFSCLLAFCTIQQLLLISIHLLKDVSNICFSSSFISFLQQVGAQTSLFCGQDNCSPHPKSLENKSSKDTRSSVASILPQRSWPFTVGGECYRRLIVFFAHLLQFKGDLNNWGGHRSVREYVECLHNGPDSVPSIFQITGISGNRVRIDFCPGMLESQGQVA